MFNKLSEKLTSSLFGLKGQVTITEDNIQDTLREIRLALLEADVNFKVVKAFIAAVKEKSAGLLVTTGVKAGEEFTKIVHDQLVTILGTSQATLNIEKDFSVIMMVGLQGSGKTTSTAKIAKLLKAKHHKRTLLVAADIYRPAAIEQLHTVGKQVGVEVFSKGDANPREIVKDAIAYAKAGNFNNVIIDTAGRLHIDQELMSELVDIKEIAKPDEILLVVDSMTGQDIINVAEGFNEKLGITGAVITKLDGDARGGAALSIRYILSVPIKLIGTGEKLDQIDYFYPDRMADRILGMGDVVSLVEKAKDVIDEKEAARAAKRMMNGQFDLEDLIAQLANFRKMGSSKMLSLIPGMPKLSDEQKAAAERKLQIIETMVSSMTKYEKRNPKCLKENTRKQRIMKGSGRTPQEFNSLLKQWEQMHNMMKMMRGNKGFGGMGQFGGPKGFGR